MPSPWGYQDAMIDWAGELGHAFSSCLGQSRGEDSSGFTLKPERPKHPALPRYTHFWGFSPPYLASGRNNSLGIFTHIKCAGGHTNVLAVVAIQYTTRLDVQNGYE
jgi:hypothetical protein